MAKDTKKEEKIDTLCKEHRKKLGLPAENFIGAHWFRCVDYLLCYKDCPIPNERDKNNLDVDYSKKPRPLGINLSLSECFQPVFGELESHDGDQPREQAPTRVKKAGKPEKVDEVAEFRERTRYVFDMLLRHPELIDALYRYSSHELKEVLLVRDAKLTTPTFMGGQMQTHPSKQTKQLFKHLENQFKNEEEGEKINGKNKN